MGKENLLTRIVTVDPTDLMPGDVVVSVSDRPDAGLDDCHCDVEVTVRRVVLPKAVPHGD